MRNSSVNPEVVHAFEQYKDDDDDEDGDDDGECAGYLHSLSGSTPHICYPILPPGRLIPMDCIIQTPLPFAFLLHSANKNYEQKIRAKGEFGYSISCLCWASVGQWLHSRGHNPFQLVPPPVVKLLVDQSPYPVVRAPAGLQSPLPTLPLEAQDGNVPTLLSALDVH